MANSKRHRWPNFSVFFVVIFGSVLAPQQPLDLRAGICMRTTTEEIARLLNEAVEIAGILGEAIVGRMSLIPDAALNPPTFSWAHLNHSKSIWNMHTKTKAQDEE
jgi:hypothetical protein